MTSDERHAYLTAPLYTPQPIITLSMLGGNVGVFKLSLNAFVEEMERRQLPLEMIERAQELLALVMRTYANEDLRISKRYAIVEAARQELVDLKARAQDRPLKRLLSTPATKPGVVSGRPSFYELPAPRPKTIGYQHRAIGLEQRSTPRCVCSIHATDTDPRCPAPRHNGLSRTVE